MEHVCEAHAEAGQAFKDWAVSDRPIYCLVFDLKKLKKINMLLDILRGMRIL